LVSIRKYRSKNGYPILKPIVNSLYNSYYYLEKNKSIINNDYLVVKYEDLVQNPNPTIDGIIEFLGIKKEKILYHPTVKGNLWVGNSTSNEKFNRISSKRLDKWKEEITPLEVYIINKLFTYVLYKYNYSFLENRNYFFPAKNEGLKSYIGNRLLYYAYL